MVRANGDSLRAEIFLEFTEAPVARMRSGTVATPFHQELGLTVTIQRGEYLVLGERAFSGADGVWERCSTSCIGRKRIALASGSRCPRR